MKVHHYREVEAVEAAAGAHARCSGAQEGAPNFIMCVFEIEPGTHRSTARLGARDIYT
jgi:hypothetical protein